MILNKKSGRGYEESSNIPTFKVENGNVSIVFYKKFMIFKEFMTEGKTANCVNSLYRFWEGY
jgi:hypothetical protein